MDIVGGGEGVSPPDLGLPTTGHQLAPINSDQYILPPSAIPNGFAVNKGETSAPTGADRPINRPTQQTDRPGHAEVILPITR